MALKTNFFPICLKIFNIFGLFFVTWVKFTLSIHSQLLNKSPPSPTLTSNQCKGLCYVRQCRKPHRNSELTYTISFYGEFSWIYYLVIISLLRHTLCFITIYNMKLFTLNFFKLKFLNNSHQNVKIIFSQYAQKTENKWIKVNIFNFIFRPL